MLSWIVFLITISIGAQVQRGNTDKITMQDTIKVQTDSINHKLEQANQKLDALIVKKKLEDKKKKGDLKESK
jgi:hypothetical protein